ncbi:Oligoendopeptidase F-like protein [Rhodospirillaceae bacterium LM-1]|nr:Oligoendopeptidase F-like protein [Rhodospirillaceae bacterium LM-1]
MTHMPSPDLTPPLPEWDLADLYAGPKAPELERDLTAAMHDAKALEAEVKGRLASLSGAEFGAVIGRFERVYETLGRVLSYAQLLHAADVADPERGRFSQTMQERATDISTHTLFFTLEINRLDDGVLADKLKDPEAARYAPWLRDLRSFRPHQLSDELEKLLHEKEVTGRASWMRLFDETMARLKFPIEGREMSITQATDLLSDPDRARRQMAGQAIGKVLGDHAPTFSLITNVLAKDKAIEDVWRKYPHPVSARNLANQVEDEVVDALVTAVKGAWDQLAHRYYMMKGRWMGLDHMDYFDRNAPLPEDMDRRYSWTEATELVLSAYGRFSPELAQIGRRFFDKPWIDASIRPGKAPGAFAHPTVPSAHPYLLVNFMGRARDVMTLAHELGHGVHQVLAGAQGPLLSETPLTLAETASVFGEMLVFRAMLEDEPDPKNRRVLLAGKVEDMLNTVVRQVAFYEFEHRVHSERRLGEIGPDRLGDMWLDVQKESLGPAFKFSDEYRHFWSYIPHFVHSPFYVYAYAFGDCLVNSLYESYRQGLPDFEEHYIEMLKAGGTKRHRDLLKPFGLDASNPAFWRQGLDVITGFIDELEKIG